ncbi:hypothetical protein HPP92_013641 [Vanilla planifolia]|uniref:Uncharacterized protein n=1 Tax=Vanilla planifolia TaxID=51239 RepID=A0A835R2C5_VANPL|nr:hypothetical protein HPP92_014078 [Vanilla planifolia]KAG0478922.1 hypothetical protein HPP92_013641 [Vanilla planifolia]
MATTVVRTKSPTNLSGGTIWAITVDRTQGEPSGIEDDEGILAVFWAPPCQEITGR